MSFTSVLLFHVMISVHLLTISTTRNSLLTYPFFPLSTIILFYFWDWIHSVTNTLSRTSNRAIISPKSYLTCTYFFKVIHQKIVGYFFTDEIRLLCEEQTVYRLRKFSENRTSGDVNKILRSHVSLTLADCRRVLSC